ANNPTEVFTNVLDIDTVYTISMWSESVYGCVSDTTTRTVIVRPDPVANFVKDDDSLCGSGLIIFSNASTGATSYSWNFGDGSTAANTHPQHQFAMNPSADTSYIIRLVATNFHGCRDTAFDTLRIFPLPTAIITNNTAAGCTPLTVNFGHSSLLSTGLQWNFGNGLSDTAQSTSSLFTNTTLYDTLYQVKLWVESVHGCLDSTDTLIRVFPLPTADFVAQPNAGCGDLTINFNNQSVPNDTGSIAIMSFVWDLGNGNTANTEDASSTYVRALTQDSIYTVTLIGTSEHGCLDTATKTVRTFPKPTANFTQSDTSGCGPLTVSFSNLSVPYDTGSIADMTFIWNFGNGLATTTQNPSATFYPSLVQDTVYTITLIAISEHGCRDTLTSTVRVHPDPSISFTHNPSNGCSPLTVNFDGTGLNVQTWHWNFANGDTSSAEDPIQVFLGRPDFDTTYTVRVWAESAYGCWSDTQSSNVIVRLIPEAEFVQNNDSLCGSRTITFTNQSTGANAYAWDFGDGSGSGTANPQHSFAMNPSADTTYTVRLIATNFYNCRDTAFGSVTLFPLPTAIITSNPSAGCTPLNVSLGHNSLLGESYFWDFGNGSTDTAQSPSSLFTNTTLYDTLYNVKLRVTSNRGCLDSTTETIRVYPLPTANFIASPQNGCGDLNVSLSNQSSPNDTGDISMMTFEWALGNGINTTAVNPTALYPRSLTQDSLFQVRLIAASEHGCLDTAFRTVRTFPKPLALFAQSDTDGCSPLTVTFSNQSIPYDTGTIAD
ncbi:MAG: PKD domain-containing protein, partial [Bacteroidota bacterium]|nr:PKD domain-containing protein [Bacteroidota bacterium]MDX5429737.1 PKD domain-containing protein [Bacteroidota bacterium]MDX5468516.1 PKD domain-containing protein [Bacteroidota bacterium]